VTTAVRTLSEPIEPIAATRCRSEVNKRRYARPIKRILDRKTGKVVGWLYEWNTGALVPMWKAARCKDVIYD
jgi:hypothetical protein